MLVMRTWLVGTRSLRVVNTQLGMLPALVALVFPRPPWKSQGHQLSVQMATSFAQCSRGAASAGPLDE